MAEEQAHAGVPRLIIKEMVLENFKSYAGAQRVGPFHKVRRSRKSSRVHAVVAALRTVYDLQRCATPRALRDSLAWDVLGGTGNVAARAIAARAE